jgi:hypothetical protein
MWYQNKADFYFKQWERAIEGGKTVAASKHMTEYLNYKEMAKVHAKRVGE